MALAGLKVCLLEKGRRDPKWPEASASDIHAKAKAKRTQFQNSQIMQDVIEY